MKYYQEYAYPSARNLYAIMKNSGEKVTQAEIEKVIGEQLVSQLHKKERVKISAHMVAYSENEKWLMDLLDMQNFSHSNKGYRWILIVCDVFTRKGYAVPLKNKNKETVLEALQKIVAEAGVPFKIISDNGSEFINNKVSPYLKKNDIFHETNEVGYHKALGVIDALSRTLKGKIYKGFTHNDNTDWVDELPRIVKGYNNSPHRGLLGFSPNQVKDHLETIQRLNEWKNQRSKSMATKFKVGQIVRKKLAKPTFSKGYKRVWSLDTYTITEIKGVNAVLDDDEEVKLNDLQIISKVPVQERAKDEVKIVEQEKRIDRRIAKEGIERKETAIKRNLRERKPNQLEDVKYGKIVY